MHDKTAQILGVGGGLAFAISTALPWYSESVGVSGLAAGSSNTSLQITYSAWDIWTLAPVLLVIAIAVGVILLFLLNRLGPKAGFATAILGLVVAAYCFSRILFVPDMGEISVGTGLDELDLRAGPFLATLSAGAVMIGGLTAAFLAEEDEAT